jgi:transcriptional regulator with XRE-family HTH domain
VDFAGDVMQAARQGYGLSRAAVATLVTVSPQTVAQWETGRSVPTPAHLIAVAQALHVTPEQLLRAPAVAADLVGLRTRTGRTANAVARQIGFSAPLLSRWETGGSAVNSQAAQRLAALYGTTAASIRAASRRSQAAQLHRSRRLFNDGDDGMF